MFMEFQSETRPLCCVAEKTTLNTKCPVWIRDFLQCHVAHFLSTGGCLKNDLICVTKTSFHKISSGKCVALEGS